MERSVYTPAVCRLSMGPSDAIVPRLPEVDEAAIPDGTTLLVLVSRIVNPDDDGPFILTDAGRVALPDRTPATLVKREGRLSLNLTLSGRDVTFHQDPVQVWYEPAEYRVRGRYPRTEYLVSKYATHRSWRTSQRPQDQFAQLAELILEVSPSADAAAA